MSKETNILHGVSQAALIKIITISASIILTLLSTIGTLAWVLIKEKYKEDQAVKEILLQNQKETLIVLQTLTDSTRHFHRYTNHNFEKVFDNQDKFNRKFNVIENKYQDLQNDFLKIDAGRADNTMIPIRSLEGIINNELSAKEPSINKLKKNESLVYR